MEYVYQVVEYVRDTRLVMRTSDGPFQMETTYEWQPTETGTRMTLRNRGTPSGFSRIVAPFMSAVRGKPWAATAQIASPQGGLRILLEPRGTRRLSSQSLLDVRVSRMLDFRGLGRIEPFVDVLNAPNDTAEEGLATDNLFSQTFGQPTLVVDPRRVMFGVRLNLGSSGAAFT